MAVFNIRVHFSGRPDSYAQRKSITAPVRKTLTGFHRRLSNMRPFFDAIADDFFNTNEAISYSDSGTKFKDLAERTKRDKRAKYGFVYPILVGSGDLRDSLTRRNSSKNKVRIRRIEMLIDSNVPYSGSVQTMEPSRPAADIKDPVRTLRWLEIASAWAATGRIR